MLIQISPSGFALVDHCGLPRYRATAWCLIVGGSLALSTLKRRLSHTDACERRRQIDPPRRLWLTRALPAGGAWSLRWREFAWANDVGRLVQFGVCTNRKQANRGI